MKCKVSDDEQQVNDIRQALKENNGYCPCKMKKTSDTKCPCKEFRTETPVGDPCHCGLYIKTEL